MTEAIPSSSPPQPSSSSPFLVFIDTNHDTHIVVNVSPHDTVSDFKGKIRSEHALCFPEMGAISVQAIKVRRRAHFYHLSDSMLVKSAFIGIKKSWFLHLDIVPSASMVENQSVSDRLPIESQALPVSLPEKTTQDSSLPSQIQKLHVSSNDQLVSGGKSVDESTLLTVAQKPNDTFSVPRTQHEKSSDPGLPEIEMLSDDHNAVDGSKPQQNSGLVDGQENKDRRGEQHGTVGDEADSVGVPVVYHKKEKSRKRSRTLQNNQVLDGKTQHSFAEKKKSKKDQSSVKYMHNQLEGSDKEMHTPEKVLNENSFQEKHENNLPYSSGFSKEPSHFDLPVQQTLILDDKQKMKKKRRSKLHDEVPQNDVVDNLLSKTNSTAGNLVAKENHVGELLQNFASLQGESDVADIPQDGALNATNTAEAGNMEMDPLPTNLKQSNFTSETLAKSTTSNPDLPIQEVSNIEPKDSLHGDSVALTEKTNAATIQKEVEKPSNHAEVVSKVPEGSRRSKKAKCEKDTTSKHDKVDSSVKLVNEDKINKASSKVSKVSGAATVDLALDNGTASKDDSGIPYDNTVKTLHQVQKNKREKSEQSNVHYSAREDQVTEENQNRTSSIHQGHAAVNKVTGAAIPGAVDIASSALVESTVPSTPSKKKPKRSRRKSEKAELHHQDSYMHSSRHDTVRPSVTQAVEEFPKETATSHLEHQGNQSKEVAAVGEAAAVTGAASKTVVPSEHEKKSKHRGKISRKVELPHNESIIGENPKVSLEDCQNETFNDHLEHSGRKPGAGVIGDAAATTHSVVPEPDALSLSKKKSKYSKNKLVKIESLMQKPSSESFDNLMKGTNRENLISMVKKNSTGMGINDLSDKHEPGYPAERKAAEEIMGLEKSQKELAAETFHGSGHEGSQDLIKEKDQVGSPKSMLDNFDFIKSFSLNADQVEPVQVPPAATDLKKLNMEKSKRKKKLNASPEGPIASLLKPPASDKQHDLKNIPDGDESGQPSSGNPAASIAYKKLDTRKASPRKAIKSIYQSDVHLHDASSDLGSPRKSHSHHDKRPGKKRQGYESNSHNQVPLSLDEKTKHLNGKSSIGTGSKLQPLTSNNDFPVRDEDGLAGPDDTTEEDTSLQSKRYRVAVRKIPTKRYGKIINTTEDEERTFSVPSTRIFEDAASGGSEDEFEIKRKDHIEGSTDSSSESSELDKIIQEPQRVTASLKSRAYKNLPGDAENHKSEKETTDAENNNLTSKSNAKTEPLSVIMKSSRSYKKAKIISSQYEFEDSVDAVLETQPELAP